MSETEDLVKIASKHREVAHLWLAHLGFTEEQILEGEKETDHSKCTLTNLGWDCLGESGVSRHELSDKVGYEIAVVGDILEFSKLYDYYLATEDVISTHPLGAEAVAMRSKVVERLAEEFAS